MSAATYKEFATVRLVGPCTGRSAYGPETTMHHFPAGTIGAIIDTLDGTAFEVEFTVREPEFSPDGEVLDYGEYCILTLRPDQIEPAS